MEITLLKLNLDGSSFIANAPFSGEEADESEASTELEVGEDRREDDESNGRGAAPFVAAVIGLLFLLGVAVVARRYLTEDGADGADVEITERVPGDIGETED